MTSFYVHRFCNSRISNLPVLKSKRNAAHFKNHSEGNCTCLHSHFQQDYLVNKDLFWLLLEVSFILLSVRKIWERNLCFKVKEWNFPVSEKSPPGQFPPIKFPPVGCLPSELPPAQIPPSSELPPGQIPPMTKYPPGKLPPTPGEFLPQWILPGFIKFYL